MNRRHFTLTALSLAMPAAGAWAQATEAWPTRPITILVPFVAGGPSDIVARVIAPHLQQALGQPVVVENRPGAGGEVAGRQLIRTAPDGHTLMVASIGVAAINAALRPNLGYDPVRDFTPVTLAVTTPSVLVVHPRTVPARDLPGVIAWLKANPRAGYSTSGIGSTDHLVMEIFKQRTGTNPAHVPYSGGAAAATDLIAGNVQLSFQNLAVISPHIAGARVRAILVTSEQRHPLLPDVPTAAEAGLADFVVTSWQAVVAPAGVTPALLVRLHREVAAALRHPKTVERMARIGFAVDVGTPEALRAFQQEEIARWRRVVQTAGIKAE